jgi:uncharacterized protein (TIGR03118 family)
MKNNTQNQRLHFNSLVITLVLCYINFSAFAATGNHYNQTNLVSDQRGKAAHTDPNLRNAWGIAFNPNGAVWIANNGSGTSTLYDGTGLAKKLIVTVEGAGGGNPTGIVFNSSKDFNGAPFIFANESGTLAAWDPSGTIAAVVSKRIPDKDPVYKGLALAGNGKAHFLYATDFHNAKVQVFDIKFRWVNAINKLGCDFSDPRIPSGFAPFGIHNIGGVLYVTYAKQDADKHDDVAGPDLGYVNIFDANGCLVRRFASGGVLNSPWGVTLAPAGFGRHSNQVLIGNFGDGSINAFDQDDGDVKGSLRNPTGDKIIIDGLWGLAFGNGVLNQPTQTLFFTAGPNDETNGLYGKLEAVK